jgi:hypothetical protein
MKVQGFEGGTLDRADQVRTNPARLAQALADPGAIWPGPAFLAARAFSS